MKFLRGKIEYARQGGHTKRFHTVQTILTDTVGHHSFNVAWIAHWLSTHLGQVERYSLLLAALEHDLPEQEFGDIPAPAKRDLGIREKWNEHEAELQHQSGYGYEDALSEEGRRILKLADALDGAFFCCNERALGNQVIEGCFKNFVRYATEVADQTKAGEVELLQMAHETWEKVSGR
jgi:5'-deoxynucleotidase YfbR-like HD superfamily hydrolase